jgi:hypothetical protein
MANRGRGRGRQHDTTGDGARVWRTITRDSDKKESVSEKKAFVGVWAFWNAPPFRGRLSVMLRENMETLIFALIASYNAHRQQEWVVGEPEEFQPFDLQALRNSAESKPIQSPRRLEAYVPQTA